MALFGNYQIDASNGDKMTYGQLNEQVQNCASGLLELGVKQTDCVMLYADNSVDYVITMLAAVYLGVPFTPMTPANGASELHQQIKDSNTTVLVYGHSKSQVVKQALVECKYHDTMKLVKIFIEMNAKALNEDIVNHKFEQQVVLKFEDLFQNSKMLPQVPFFPIEQSDRFMMVYTSGSTGLPKGTIHSQRSQLAILFNIKQSPERKELFDSISSLWHPMGHISGIQFLLDNIQHRTTTLLFNTSDLKLIVPCLEKYRVNTFIMSMHQAIKFVEEDYHKQYDLSQLMLFAQGGCKFQAHVIRKIQENYPSALVVEKYGSTECFGQMTMQYYGKEDLRIRSVLLPNMEMKIIDLDSGKNLPTNQNGEICFRGPTCFVGYLNNEEKTKEAIDELGWYHTGDVGYYDEEHNLFIVDRIKELIKFKYWSVAPAEIEEFLQTHHAVEEVCVVGVKHISGTHVIRAYVKVKDGEQTTENELIQYVQDNMGIQKRLHGGVRFVDRIPKTLISKIDRQYFKNLIKDELLEIEI